jgi:Ribosomal protein L9, C-terminal domain
MCEFLYLNFFGTRFLCCWQNVVLPDIKALGTFSASIRLHPEVIGEFKVVVQKEKQVQ